jgi:Xaa-Pro aminopeptidase
MLRPYAPAVNEVCAQAARGQYDLSTVPDVLILADTIRSPELRHEVPVAIPDPFLYVEREGARHVVVASLELPRVEALDGLETHALEEFGLDELSSSGLERYEVELEIHVRACRELGIGSAVVPPGFPLATADRLRREGIEVTPDHELFVERRRVKNEHELAGIRRAQGASEAAMGAAAALLRAADVRAGMLRLEGEPLTCERIKEDVEREFTRHGAFADEFIVSHGAQTAIGHDMGSGPIAAGEPIVLDLFPRDRESGCFADMTRTFVVGEAPDELRTYWQLCREALDIALDAIRPGVEGRELHRLVCDYFHEHGYPTQLSKEPGSVLRDGFFHSLGHGVGLEVHEDPGLGRTGGALVSGDVVAVEPGLYRSGFGGCRLEDLVLVTEDGAENLTDYPYDLEVQ